MIRVLLADDQQMFIDGIQSILSTVNNIEIIGVANNGLELLEKLEENQPDVILLDINMPEMDGIETCKRVKKQYPKSKILILSTYSHKSFVANLISLGADGYLLKNTGKDELVLALETVNDGENYYSSDIKDVLNENKKSDGDEISFLSKREIEVLRLIGQGNTNTQIAEKLFLSPYTVETHRKNMMHKLQLKNSAELVKYAVDRGLV
ncbi:MAG: response regulator transcription factor [Schleiferiaceae bacterium]